MLLQICAVHKLVVKHLDAVSDNVIIVLHCRLVFLALAEYVVLAALVTFLLRSQPHCTGSCEVHSPSLVERKVY